MDANVLKSDYVDFHDQDMFFQFAWVQHSQNDVRSYILSQPNYLSSQHESDANTGRCLDAVHQLYYIDWQGYRAQSLEQAQQLSLEWARMTVHAIMQRYTHILATNSSQSSHPGSTTTELTADDTHIADVVDVDGVRAQLQQNDTPLVISADVLFNAIKNKIFGQDDALKGVSQVVSRHICRTQPARPATLFAVGPSGVGKTKTAIELMKLLNHQIVDQSQHYQFLRLDMSEYQEEHRVSQLLGAPQGYVGHGQGSELIQALQRNPKHIVLFDEIEKAHPAILKALMNSVDAGRLSSASAQNGSFQVDCKLAIFLFTSNLACKGVLDDVNQQETRGNIQQQDEICRLRMKESGIAPEIIGRMGKFVVYQSLSKDSRIEIVAASVIELAAEYGLRIQRIAPSIICTLLEGQSSEYFGARTDRNRIEDLLADIFIEAKRHGDLLIELCDSPLSYQRCVQNEPLTEQNDTTDE